MKIKLRIRNFTPDRENYRIEKFKSIQIQKVKKEKTTGRKQVDFEDESFSKTKSPTENLAKKIIEISTEEPVYEFPSEGLENYLMMKTQIKLTGALGVIRKFFPSADKDKGGVRGLKEAFDMAWSVSVVGIEDVGEIIPNGLENRFTYKGGRGGMGIQRFDVLTEYTVVVVISNPVLEWNWKDVYNKSIDFLEACKVGRSGSIEILDKSS